MGRAREISNTDDVIDSLDVIARIEELEEEREALADELAECKGDPTRSEMDATQDVIDWDISSGAELASLKKFAAEAESYANDWKHGAVLIREAYFTEYCEDLCDQLGEMPKDFPSYITIDWEATARNLRMDYTEAEWDGVTYLVR